MPDPTSLGRASLREYTLRSGYTSRGQARRMSYSHEGLLSAGLRRVVTRGLTARTVDRKVSEGNPSGLDMAKGDRNGRVGTDA
jgi:hypothetical protein